MTHATPEAGFDAVGLDGLVVQDQSGGHVGGLVFDVAKAVGEQHDQCRRVDAVRNQAAGDDALRSAIDRELDARSLRQLA